MRNYMETIKDKMSEEEMADYLVRKMTVDMSIDKWQTINCAIEAVDLMLFAQNLDHEYWNNVKNILSKR